MSQAPRVPVGARGWAFHAARLAPWGAGVAALAAALAVVSPYPVGVFWDDGVYLLTAKALATGQGYRYPHLPGQPPAVHYPPLWPALLAAGWHALGGFPRNLLVLKLLNPLLHAVAAAGVVLLGTRRLGCRPLPLAAGVIVAAAIPPVLVLTNGLFSEPLFAALLVPVLWLAERAADPSTPPEAARRDAWLVGLATGVLCLARTQGILVAPVIALVLLGRRGVRAAAEYGATTAALLVPWQWWVATRTPALAPELRGFYGTYGDWMEDGFPHGIGELWAVAAKNLAILDRTVGVTVAPGLPAAAQHLGAALALAACAAGAWLLRRRAPVVTGVALMHVAFVVAFPWQPDRYFFGPWLFVPLLLAPGAANPRRVLAAAAVVLLAGHAAYAARGFQRGSALRIHREQAERLWPLVTWVRAHASPTAVVGSDAAVMIGLYTPHTVVPVSMISSSEYLRPKTPAEVAAELRTLEARFRPGLLLYTAGSPEAAAVPAWVDAPGAPRLELLAPAPGGGTAFAVRRP